MPTKDMLFVNISNNMNLIFPFYLFVSHNLYSKIDCFIRNTLQYYNGM